MATLIALTAVGYISQALFMKGITETAGSIYDTIHDVCFTNCPELLAFLEEFDLEFKINTIQQFFNEIEIEKKSQAIETNLQDIYQVILLFKQELKKIKKILKEHPNKYFHKLRKPDYKKELNRLKIYSKLFDKRLSLFKILIKTFSSSIITIKSKKKVINLNGMNTVEVNNNNNFLFNEDEYEIL